MSKNWKKLEKFVWILVLVVVLIFLISLRNLDLFSMQVKGVLFFILVPLWIWAVGTLFINRSELTAKIFAFLAGADNRLSLSRLQAFTWTLVIFGSWVAAMGIHNKIVPTTEAKQEEFNQQLKSVKDQTPTLKTVLDKASAELVEATQAKEDADKQYRTDAAAAQVFTAKDPASDEATQARETASQSKDAAAQKNILFEQAAARKTEAEKLYNENLTKVAEAEKIASGFNWVLIPPALLALAGIAIGSGIFSSVISAVNSTEKTAGLTGIEPITLADFKTKYPDKPVPISNNLFLITGRDLGKSGKVRFCMGRVYSIYAPVLVWSETGTEIVVDVPDEIAYDTLVVDTPNGKLPHQLNSFGEVTELVATKANIKELKNALQKFEAKLTAKSSGLESAALEAVQNDFNKTENSLIEAQDKATNIKDKLLGPAKYYYEFSDLFRDDKDPGGMDLMKFQMFGWMIIAVAIYSFLFLNNLSSDIESLPLVPSSIVILTGLSQAGYLAGKGVSNINTKKD